MANQSPWDKPGMTETVYRLADEGLSRLKIAIKLGLTLGQVCGKLDRRNKAMTAAIARRQAAQRAAAEAVSHV